MKKIVNRVLLVCVLAFAGTACNDDDTLTYLTETTFSGPIEVTPDAIVINAVNRYEPVLNVSWPAVQFPVDAPITYAVQIDVPSGIIGTTAWSNAVTITGGVDVLSKSFLGNTINDIALGFGLLPDVAGQLAIRVSATLNRTAYSEPVIITVTPYVPVITVTEIYMPGSYQGWNPATAAKLRAIDAGVFQGYATFPEGALNFKFTTEMNWDEFYGSTGGNGIAAYDDDDIFVPAPGSYQITVNLNTFTFTAVPYSYGIIGTATAGGWDADTDMVFDHVAEQWTYTGDLVPGEIKFRLNDAWTINYGSGGGENGEISDGTVLLDNQGAHFINEAGNYTVTFAVNQEPGTATYSIIKN